MAEAYRELGLNDLAGDAERVLSENRRTAREAPRSGESALTNEAPVSGETSQ